MNNKEAIEEIKSMGLIIDAATSGTRRKSIYEALTLAIKALEERPIDDLSEYSDKLWQKAYERGKTEARKTGHWIEHTSEEMSKLGFVKCSKCKAGFRRYERGIRHSDLPWIDGQPYELHLIDNFCPNCGADMRGGNDGT